MNTEIKEKKNIHCVVMPSAEVGTKFIANEIAELIRTKTKDGKLCVLGLATGASPIQIYKELIRLHKEENLSFKNVVTFNLDEYCGLNETDPQSYFYFMHEHLFNHIDILKENIHIPNGELSGKELESFCVSYEQKIQNIGDLDFQLLGIGRTGHIGFNESGSKVDSITRVVTLNNITLRDAGPAFEGIDNVPKTAVTIGVDTVLKAKRIVLLAWGNAKSSIIKDTIEGEVTEEIPATYLQNHVNTTFVIDEAAASELAKFN